jgi:argininosuccinate lyase
MDANRRIEWMAFSDRLVYQALCELIERHGQDAIISQRMIRELAATSQRTTERALQRLVTTGQVIADFTVGVGYRYRIAHEQLAQRYPERSPAT